MNNARAIHPAALRRALLVDAAASGGTGVVLLLAASPLAPLLGLPTSLLRWTGVVLIPFAALLIWVARSAHTRLDMVRAIIVGNALWVIGSILLLVSGWVAPTRLGELFVLAQAVAVAIFAYLEYDGLRRIRVSPLRSAAAAASGSARPEGVARREPVGAATAPVGEARSR